MAQDTDEKGSFGTTTMALSRAMQFPIFSSPPQGFDPFPHQGEGGDGGKSEGEGKDGQARVPQTA